MRRERSPNYPRMNLEQAVLRAKHFYEQNKRYPVGRTPDHPDAFKSLGFSGMNGASLAVLATLIGFGLLEKAKGNTDADVRVSDLGFKIAALPSDSPEWIEAVREAARRPKVYQELWSQFPEGLPAHDSPIQTFLINRGFSPSVCKSLIEDFRATIAFAKLDEVEDQSDSQGEAPEAPGVEERAHIPTGAKPTAESSERKHPLGYRTLVIPVISGGEFSLSFPNTASSQDMELLLQMLKLLQRSLPSMGTEDEVMS